MGMAISMEKLAAAIQSSMEGFQLDGISLPKDARVMTDVLGEMMYYKQDAVDIESLPEETRETIRKYIDE